jgi:hypothetical protein
MVVDSATSQLGGLLVASAGGVATSVFLRRSGFVPATLEVGRIGQGGVFATPNLLTLAIPVSAGIAGALAHAIDPPVSIAGVAVAIVPAAAAAGVGTAWGDPVTVVQNGSSGSAGGYSAWSIRVSREPAARVVGLLAVGLGRLVGDFGPGGDGLEDVPLCPTLDWREVGGERGSLVGTDLEGLLAL